MNWLRVVATRATLPFSAWAHRNDPPALAIDMVFSEADSVRTGAATATVIEPRIEAAVCLVLMLGLGLGIAHAEEFDGKVIRVSDGDTLTILDAAQAHQTIRLAGIDAPERGQPYGVEARENLIRLALGRDARLECHKTDRYRRKVCKVYVHPVDCPDCGLTLDVGLVQIDAGLAWWYQQYAREQSEEDRGRYEAGEASARLERRGMWSDADPLAPWEWRNRRQIK